MAGLVGTLCAGFSTSQRMIDFSHHPQVHLPEKTWPYLVVKSPGSEALFDNWKWLSGDQAMARDTIVILPLLPLSPCPSPLSIDNRPIKLPLPLIK